MPVGTSVGGTDGSRECESVAAQSKRLPKGDKTEMNRIKFPIKLQEKGPAVADLQSALRLLLDRNGLVHDGGAGRANLASELARGEEQGLFGGTTRKLVSLFQEHRHLEGSGVVDEATAAELNAQLKEWGMMDHSPGPGSLTYQVDGKVQSRVSTSVSGLRVVIVDKGVGGDAQLVKALTNDRGAYQATFSDAAIVQRCKTQPDIQARVFAGDTLVGTSDVHYNASTHETLDVVIDDKASSA